MKNVVLSVVGFFWVLGCIRASGQNGSSFSELDVGNIVLTNKLDLTNISSLGQPAGRFVISDGAGGVQYSTFVSSNAGPWRFIPLENGGLSITNPNNGADMLLGADGSVVFGSQSGSIGAGGSFVFGGVATNTGFAVGGSANGFVSTTIFGDAEGAQSISLAGTTTTNASSAIAIGYSAVADAAGATVISDSTGYTTNSIANSLLLAFLQGVRIKGGLAIATNSPPNPMAGNGIFWSSNYDLYWVTPAKTNLIVIGH
jgi:hypothetical protein